MNDNSHFLRSMAVAHRGDGQEYYGQRCAQIADAIDLLLADNEQLRAKLRAWENWFSKPYDNFTPPPIQSSAQRDATK